MFKKYYTIPILEMLKTNLKFYAVSFLIFKRYTRNCRNLQKRKYQENKKEVKKWQYYISFVKMKLPEKPATSYVIAIFSFALLLNYQQ